MLLYPNTLYSWDLRFWIVVSRSVIKSITGLKFYFTLFIHLFNIYILICTHAPLTILIQQWMNSDLTWNEADYNGTKVIHVSPRKVWAPDIILYNRWEYEPFHPNISVHILYTALHAVLKALTRRNCLTIKSVLSWWSFPFFWWF